LVRLALPTRRRFAMTLAGLVVAAGLASSCSLDAAVSTDDSGRVVGIDALRLRSDALALAVVVALVGTEMVLELRWRPLPGESSSLPL
jgi:hypothetical protein